MLFAALRRTRGIPVVVGATSYSSGSLFGENARQLVESATAVTSVQFGETKDELKLRLMTSDCQLYRASLRESPFVEPYKEPWWSFLWPGSYGIARHAYENRGSVVLNGAHILDFACGGGAAALSALDASSPRRVLANDIDPYAYHSVCANVELNAERLNEDCGLAFTADNLIGLTLDECFAANRNMMSIRGASHADDSIERAVIFAGDVCYEEQLARDVIDWLFDLASDERVAAVLVGDPGRHFLPTEKLTKVATYELPSLLKDANYAMTSTSVWRVDSVANGCSAM